MEVHVYIHLHVHLNTLSITLNIHTINNYTHVQRKKKSRCFFVEIMSFFVWCLDSLEQAVYLLCSCLQFT